MTRGLLVGVAILLVGYVAWGFALDRQAVSPTLEIVFLVLPAVAGFVSVWLAPRGGLAPGVLLAVPAAVFAGILNLKMQTAGTDVGAFTGVLGVLRVAGFTLLWSGLFCAIGGLIAVIARQVRGTA
jgi:hypothetical protein